jgi:ribokinase
MINNITIVGSYNVGLFLKGERLPATGETVIADEFVESGGGKGSNQAVAASVLGAPVRFIGRLGSDRYGQDALEMYQKLGIETDWITVDDSIHSGISVILIDSEGRNLISVVPGANLHLSSEDMDAAEVIFRQSMIVGFQLENSVDTVEYAIRKVHSLGVSTFLDPAPAVRLPEDIYQHIGIIKPNETEASILTGMDVTDPGSALKAGRWFCERGVETAIITLGAGGAALVTEGFSKHHPAPEVEAVDSTGAGDIFSGGFLAALSSGHPIVESVVFALHAASLSATRLGVIESIPTLPEVRTFMEQVASS